jgi:hypothetical protein
MTMREVAVWCLAGSLVLAGRAEESRSIYGILEADPASVLLSPDVDGFSLTRSYSSRYYSYTMRESCSGIGSWAPMLRGGAGFVSNKLTTDVTIGGGALVNGCFVAPMGALSVDIRLRPNRLVTIGPHLALVTIGEPEWQGIADVSFSSTSGFEAGLDFTVGKRRVAFGASLSYISLSPLDVTTEGGWVASSDQLDLSGAILKLGAVFHF